MLMNTKLLIVKNFDLINIYKIANFFIEEVLFNN